MKKIKNVLTIFLSLTLLFSANSFAESSTASELSGHEEISAGLEAFSESLYNALPEAATQQNVWADTYMGKLFPSIIPHMGAGVSIGGTVIDMSGLKTAAEGIQTSYEDICSSLGDAIIASGSYVSLPSINFGLIPETFILPTASVDIRLGGVLLPMDIGLCAIATNPALSGIDWKNVTGIPATLMSISNPINFNTLGFNMDIDYLTLGADFRFRVIPEGDILPGLSLGGGYYYIAGSFAVNSEDSTEISGVGTQTTTSSMELDYSTQVIFAQIQLSKRISSCSFFVGGRGLLASTTTAWKWSFSSANDGESEEAQALCYSDSDSSENAEGTTSLKEAFSSMTSGSFDWTNIRPQLYAGAGFNFWVVQITASVCADVRSLFENSTDFIWSGALSCHVKL